MRKLGMKIYIDGKLSSESGCFVPMDLYFSTEENEKLYKVSENCVCISGHECSSSLEGKNFSARWKDVFLHTAEGFSEVYNATEILEAIKGKTFKAIMYYDSDECDSQCEVSIDKITIVDNQETKTIIPNEHYSNPIPINL